MESSQPHILTINGGSSSIKFALFGGGASLHRIFDGAIDGLGAAAATFHVRYANGAAESQPVRTTDHEAAVGTLMDWIEEKGWHRSVEAVGHRVVHGGPRFHQPQQITPDLLDELQRLQPFDPEHLPDEILLIRTIRQRFPRMSQIACFDTAFHHDLPRVAQILPIPRRYESQGVRRYGFHGLSYAFLMEELGRLAGDEAARGRVVLAHLGNGSSLAAVRDGHPVDTSMGFTPAAGVPMGTRSGDLDPGLIGYLARTEQMTPERFNEMVNASSGLLGVSETTSDMRELLENEGSDHRAAEAVAMFCYRTKQCLGGFAAALGGLDTLVFSGGIGENAPTVRARICEGLSFIGIVIDDKRNADNQNVISTGTSQVTVRVMRTDEQVMIAKATRAALGMS